MYKGLKHGEHITLHFDGKEIDCIVVGSFDDHAAAETTGDERALYLDDETTAADYFTRKDGTRV